MIITGVALALTLVCSFLPWVTVWIVTVNGIDGDGKITAVLSLIAGGLLGTAAFKKRDGSNPKGWIIGSLVASVAIFGTYAYDLINAMTSKSGENDFIQVSASPQIGLWLGVLAAIAALVGQIMLLRDLQNAPSTNPTTPPTMYR